MATTQLKGDVNVENLLTAGDFTAPPGSISNAAIASNADIDASKLEHQYPFNYNQANGSDVVSETRCVGIAGDTGIIKRVTAVSPVAPSADTDYYTVQVNRIRSGASVDVLSSVITYNNTNSGGNWGPVDGTINGSNDDLQDDDVIQVVVTAVNNGGSQAQGCIVTIWVDVDYVAS